MTIIVSGQRHKLSHNKKPGKEAPLMRLPDSVFRIDYALGYSNKVLIWQVQILL